LKGATVYKNDFEKTSPHSDFLSIRSLCGLHHDKFKDIQHRVFISFQNPLLHVMQKYNGMINPNSPNYDWKVSKMSFIEYLNSSSAFLPENSNALIRAILCEPSIELDDKHLHVARTFLNEKVYVGDLKDFTAATIHFQHRFKWWRNQKSSSYISSVSDCMENSHKINLEKQERVLQRYDINEQKNILHKIIDSNFYDFSIYMDYEKQKQNDNASENNVRSLGRFS